MTKTKPALMKLFKENWEIITVVIMFLAIKLYYAFTKYRLLIWDESVYIGIGKYIFSLGQSGLWEIIRPLGLSIITGFMWFLGIKSDVGVAYYETMMLLFSCALLIMVYVVAKEIFNKRVAIISSIICAVTPLFFLYSGYILTEIPSAVFALLAIHYYVNKKYLVAGIFTGITFMFKFPQGIILPILLATVILYGLYELVTKYNSGKKSKKIDKQLYTDTSKKALWIIAGFLIITVPFFIFNFVIYHQYTGTITDAVFRPVILAAPHQSNPFEGVITSEFISKIYNIFYYIIVMAKDYWLLGLFIPALIFVIYKLYNMYIKKKLPENQLIILVSVVIYMLYWSAISNKQERFFVMMLPFVAMIIAYTLWNIAESRLNSKVHMGLFIGIVIFTLLTSWVALGVDAKYYTWRHSLDTKPEIITGLYTQLDAMNIDGSILITDPVFSTFTDKKLIPYYFSVKNEITYFNEWEKSDMIGAVEFNGNALACLPEDTVCIESKKQLLSNIQSEYSLVLNKTYYDSAYYIFVPKK